MSGFAGAKIALIKGNEVLVAQRDDVPGLIYVEMRDFAGGGRGSNESCLE